MATGAVALKGYTSDLYSEINETTQIDRGRDVEALITKISNTKFEELKNECEIDKAKKIEADRVKHLFAIGGVVLAVVSVIAAIATILFSAGTVAAGAAVLAVVSGLVGVTTAFGNLDRAIGKYIKYSQEEQLKRTNLMKLEGKVNEVKELLKGRMTSIDSLKGQALKNEKCREVLGQVKRINEQVRKIKDHLPEGKRKLFSTLDPSPLKKYLPPEETDNPLRDSLY